MRHPCRFRSNWQHNLPRAARGRNYVDVSIQYGSLKHSCALEMLDQALVGSVVTGVLGLIAQAISKCKCYVACKRDEENEICEPQCTCGFLDSTLLDMKSPDIKDET